MVYNLPFEVERACRCSFLVRLNDGQLAYISNANMLMLANHPETPFQVMMRMDPKTHIERPWIVVARTEWTLGFKKPMFCPDERRF